MTPCYPPKQQCRRQSDQSILDRQRQQVRDPGGRSGEASRAMASMFVGEVCYLVLGFWWWPYVLWLRLFI